MGWLPEILPLTFPDMPEICMDTLLDEVASFESKPALKLLCWFDLLVWYPFEAFT